MLKLERAISPDCGREHFVEEVDRANFFRWHAPRCEPCQIAWDKAHPRPVEIRQYRTVTVKATGELTQSLRIGPPKR